MLTSTTAARIAGISVITLLFLFCNSAKDKLPQPVIEINDYLGLKTGNSWEYIVVNYELAKTPESKYEFVAMDSVVQTKFLTAPTDSTWYYTIKDSLFFKWNYLQQQSGYLDTPVVSVYRDTCIRHATGFAFNCDHCGGLLLDGDSHQLVDSMLDGGIWYTYFWKKLGPPVNFVYFTKNIGLTMQGFETLDSLQGRGNITVLRKFNGTGNNLAELYSNYRIDGSYVFKRGTSQ